MTDLVSATLTIAGASSESWWVRRAHVREALSTPTRAEVWAVTTEVCELDDLIGMDASLELSSPDGGERAFHGVVIDVAETALRSDAFELRVVFASKLALLTLGRDHRIFLDKTVEEVVTDVFDRGGVASLAEWHLDASYEPHENIVQYGESDLDFVSRLLFEEGIGYIVEQDAAGERVVLFDDDATFQAIEGDTILPLVINDAARGLGLTSLAEHHRVASDEVMQLDYDLANPSTDLGTTAEAPEATAREVYLHPGHYVDPGRGQRLTDLILERLRMRTRTANAQSNVMRVATGRFFTVAGAARADADGDFIVVEAEHSLHADGDAGDAVNPGLLVYQNAFEVIPIDVPFRPQAAPEPPVISGVQHAIVTVPSGEEIHADENGRTKVRFLWDRSGIMDDTSSTWLRVGQMALGGSMIMPRVDFEVLVDFEMGDTDRPAVSGHLYNAELPPPYALPGGCTVSSMQTATTGGGPGANELRFEDAAGSEEIFVNASKDMTVSVDNDSKWEVGNNQSYTVGSNNTLSVKATHEATVVGSRTVTIGGNQNVDVGGLYGDLVGGDLTASVGGNRFVKAGEDHTETVNGNLTRTVGSLQCITGLAGVERSVVGDATVDVGAAWAELCGQARGLSVTGAYDETVGALKFIKTKGLSVSCDVAYTMNGAAELTKAGGGRSDEAKGAVALSAAGQLKIQAKSIVFEAKSKLVFRGGAAKIELTKAGAVTISAPKVKIENSEALNQLMHKSN